MEAMIIDNNVIKQYKGADKSVTIPKGIRRIDDFAFENSSIERIEFEDSSLKIIGEYAFSNSVFIKEIMLPDSVISIGTGAFKGCTSLECIYIPPSVLDIDGEILSDGCKTIIVGESNSLAEEYATARNILFKVGYRKVKQAGAKENSDSNTKEFNIFGVKVSCSKGFPVFLANKQYYEDEKTKLYNSVLAMLPSDTKASTKFDKEMINKQCDITVNRLKLRNIIVTRDQVLNMVYDSALGIYQLMGKYYELASDVKKGLNTDITNMRNELDAEAARKITGVNYGVIGGPLDMVLYNIDNAIAARKQYNQAISEAQTLDYQYTNKLVSQADSIMAKLYKEMQPLVKDTVSSFIDALCDAENTILSDAGIMNLDEIKSADETKSSRFINSLRENDEDGDYKIGLALKHNPYNTSIYKKAFMFGLVSDELIEMIRFLDLGQDVNKLIDSYHFNNFIYPDGSINERITMLLEHEAMMSDRVIREMVSRISSTLSNAKEEVLSKKTSVDCDVKDYCSKTLNNVVDETLYNNLFAYCNSNNLSTFVNLRYSDLLNDWINTKEKIIFAYGREKDISSWEYRSVDETIEKKQKENEYENEYKEIVEILSAKEWHDIDRDAMIARLEKLGDYKDCLQLIERLKGFEFDEEYEACIKIIEETASTEELDSIIGKLSKMDNYKDSNSYIKTAKDKKNRLIRTAKEDEIEHLRTRINAACSEAEFEEIEKIIRPRQYESGYIELNKEFVLKKNEGFIEQIKNALASVKNKTDCQALKEMIQPRMDELGIRDLYMQAYNKYEEFDSAEKYEQIMAKAEMAKSIEEYDEIIQDLRVLVRTNKDAEMQIRNMTERKNKLAYGKVCEEINNKLMKARSTEELDSILQDTVSKLPSDVKFTYTNAIDKLQSINKEIHELEVKSAGLSLLFKSKQKAEIKSQIDLKKQEKQELINGLKMK